MIRIYRLKYEHKYRLRHMNLYVDIQTQAKDRLNFALYNGYICSQSSNKMEGNLKYSQLWLAK